MEGNALRIEEWPSEFQRIMESVLEPYMDWLMVYIDDILVFSKSIEEHIKHLRILLHVLYQN